jgi:hypothetical protein
MEKFKVLRYVYDDIEEALYMSECFQEFFQDEFVYQDHEIYHLQNGRFMIVYKIADETE